MFLKRNTPKVCSVHCITYLPIFFYFVKQPTKAQLQLIYKLSPCYMFRHYCVILRELVIGTLPSYTSISIAACLTWQGNVYELPEDDTIVSKHVVA